MTENLNYLKSFFKKRTGYYVKDELKELRDTSTIPIKKLTSYDVDSRKDSFLQVAELVKQNKAKIISMNMSVDATGELFAKTISFEIMVADWDTP